MSDTAQKAKAYDLGYKSGFSQTAPDTRSYEAAGMLWDTYYQGRLDGFNDYMQARTKTGVI